MSNAEVDRLVGDIIAARRARPAPVEPEPVESDGPVTRAELSLWLAEMVADDAVGASRPVAVEIDGPVDADALERALAGLGQRHEPLRTSYPFVGDEPVRRVHETTPTLSRRSFETDADLQDLLREARRRRFDLEREIPISCQLAESPSRTVLIIAISHIAFDGWSETILLSDLEELYAAEIDGRDADLPPLTTTYGAHARRQRADESDGRSAAATEYWRAHIPELPTTALQFPPAATPAPYAPVQVRLDAHDVDRLRTTARALRTTPFVLALTGLELAIRARFADDDFVVMFPASGRDDPATHDLIGCFINALAITADPGDDERVGDLVRRCHEHVMTALTHRHASLRQVRAEAGVDLRSPLGRVWFQWREFPDRSRSTQRFTALHVPAPEAQSLSIRIVPDTEGAEIIIEYPGDAERRSVEAHAQDLATALRRLPDVIDEPAGSVLANLPPDAALPPVPSVVEAIAETVAGRPTDAAIETWAVGATEPSDVLTYGDLWHRSGQVAAVLHRAGARSGSRVAIVGPTAAGTTVAMLATLRLGAVATPIDNSLPDRRQAQLVDLAGVEHIVVVGEAGTPWSVEAPDARVDRSGRIDGFVEPRAGYEPATDAYIFFTSGTTGDPKGVLGTHRGLAQFIAWERGLLDVDRDDRVAAIAGPSFDVSLRDTFLPLTAGGRLCVPEGPIDPTRAVAWLRDTGATVAHITPTLAEAWLLDDVDGGAESQSTGLRATLFSGEPLSGELVEQWGDRLMPDGRTFNLYGPTETCMIRTWFEVSRPAPLGLLPAGRPLPGTTVTVEGTDGTPLLPGERGEVVIRTTAGTRGYLKDLLHQPGPQPRRESQPGTEVQTYKTGDRGVIEGGVLRILGRLDDQVKIDGVRIEPEEVRAQLASHPGVAECRVLTVDHGGRARLHAFVLPTGPEPIDYRRFLRERLPAAAVPSSFTTVDGWPLTPTNKVDRAALIARVTPTSTPAPEAESSGTGFTTIRSIWERVLEVPAVGGEDDFYALGGTSLRAVRIRAAIEDQLGVAVPMRLCLDAPRFREFVARVDEVREAAQRSVPAARERLDTDGIVDQGPMTTAQEADWVAAVTDPAGRATDLRRVFRVTGPLDRQALARAVDHVFQDHAALRTRLGLKGASPMAVVDPPSPGNLHVVPIPATPPEPNRPDLPEAPTPGADTPVPAEDFARAATAAPLDLANGPLMECTLGVIDERSHVFIVRGHHGIIDGAGLELFFAEVADAYRRLVAGGPLEPREDATSFLEYARAQRRHFASDVFRRRLERWTDVLTDAPPAPQLTSDLSSDTASHQIVEPLTDTILERVEATARRTGSTTFVTSLALWAGFVMDTTQVDDVLIGTPLQDVSWQASQSTIGSYVNVVPIRIRRAETDTLDHLIATVRRAVVSALDGSTVPLERIVQARRDPDHHGLVQHQFQTQTGANDTGSNLELEGLTVERVPLLRPDSGVESYCRFYGVDRLLLLTVRGGDIAEAHDLARRFLEFAERTLEHPDQPFSTGEAVSSAAATAPNPATVALNFAQQRMWFLDQLHPDVATYNVPSRHRIEGSLDPDILGTAFEALIQRHDALRTRIETHGGEPLGVLDSRAQVPLTVHDCRGAPPSEVTALLDGRMETPLALEEPIVRADLVRCADDEWMLQLVVHHAVVDLWSLGIIWSDLSELYNATLEGRPPVLDDLRATPRQIARRERERFESGGYDDDLAYWADVLRPPLPSHWPRRRTRERDREPGLVRVSAQLDEEFAARFEQARVELGLTPFMLGSAISALAIGAHLGRDDVVFGTPFADRETTASHGVVGLFVNTVAFRHHVPDRASLREIAGPSRDLTLGAYAHAGVPFDLVVDRVNADRSGEHPLVDSLFSLRGELTTRVSFGETRSSPVPLDRRIAKTPLDIQLSVRAGTVELTLVGNDDYFTAAELERLRDRWVGLASQGCGDLDAPLEIHRSAPTTGETSVLDRIDAMRALDPRAPAVVGPGATLDRQTLSGQADDVAQLLLDRDLTPGTLVGVLADRGAETIAAALGIWRAGHVYVPLDPGQPRARLERIVTAHGIPVVIGATAATVPDLPVPTLWPNERPATVEHRDLPPAPAPDDAAYVIFTSGSTGDPKGVVVTHGALAAFCTGATDAYRLAATDRVLHFHSPAFDTAVEETFLPLSIGATVVLRSPSTLGSLDRMLSYCNEHAVTILDLPTALWREFAGQDLSSAAQLLGALRLVIIGGEAADRDSVTRWVSHLGPRVPLINSYGPTETTVAVTTARLTADDPEPVVPIGQPLASADLDVRDQDGRPTADWGELWVTGPQLARGYLGDEATTAECFPWADGRRWYRTGDRARRRPDGSFEVAGRLDGQLKIDGHRVEPGEIEQALRRHRSVAAASVFLDTTGPTPLLVAAIVPNGPIDVDDVRSHLVDEVPPAMVPHQIRVLAELPRTIGGKIDRRALLALGDHRGVDASAGPAADPPAPAAPPEANPQPGDLDLGNRLRRIWQALLDVDEISPTDNFFDLGGRSLTAVRLAHEIAEQLDLDVPVIDIFDHPTLGDLTVHLGGEPAPVDTPAAETAPASPAPPSRNVRIDSPSEPRTPVPDDPPNPGDRDVGPIERHDADVAPMSSAQRRMWLHDQLRDGAIAYTIPVTLRLRGLVDPSAVHDAVAALVERHAILRTRFVPDHTGHAQQVIDPSGPELTEIDLAGVPPRDRLRAAEEAAAAQLVNPFDLAAEPPFRALLATLDDHDHLVAFAVHHLAFDAQSLTTIVDDLVSDLAHQCGHDVQPASPPAVAFADYAIWQREQLASGAVDASLAYWEDQLRDLEPSELPGRLRNPEASGRATTHHVDLADHVAQQLGAIASGAETSTFQVAVALTTALLHRITGSTDVTVGTPQNERRHPSLERTVGPFVNMAVLRSRVDSSAPFTELLRSVRRTTAEALEHGAVPFEAIVDRLNPPRDPMRLPFFDVTCVAHEPDAAIEINRPGFSVERHALLGEPLSAARRNGSLSDLMIAAELHDGRMQLTLRHDPGVLDEGIVEQLASALQAIAVAVTAHPDTNVGDLPILEPAERTWLTDSLNDTAVPFESTTRIEARFARVVEARPDAPAIRHGERALSYRELASRAERLGDDLRDAGVTPGTAVGVEAHRSIELVIALLAILDCGAAYVPLDPESPAVRNDEILDRAGVGVVLKNGPGGLRVLTRPSSGPPPAEIADAAYVMFTSGSTGTPKGVVVPHRAVQRLVTDPGYATLDSTMVVAMGSNPAFDALTFEIWGALLNGGQIVVFDREDLVDADRLVDRLGHEHVTTGFFTTALFNSIVATRPDAFAGLRDVLVGGEALDPASVARALEHPPTRLVNVYGPTECTTFSSWHRITALRSGESIPIGLPIANTELHVLDDRGRLVPPGVTGELHIGGPGLAIGYLGDPALTAERFRHDALDGRRLYRTGDRARRRRDGRIEFLGRADNQIKLRGHRIELGEIEAALCTGEHVQAAAARIVGDGPRRRIVAHVVAEPDGFDAESIRRKVADVLPAYMVPTRVGRLDALPLTPQGKVDRAALPPLDVPTHRELPAPDGAASTLLAVWRRVLDQPDVGLDDDFFESGGNSLLAIELLALLENELHVRAPLSIIFESRTARSLAAALGLETTAAAPAPLVRAVSGQHTEVLHVGTDSTLTPLWAVHPAGGALSLFEPLVRRLDGRRSVFGVLPPGVRDNLPPLDSVEALVDHQLANILARQASGPYHLIGYSLGGILAFEVARRLIDGGHEVAFVGVVESSLPRPDGAPATESRLASYVRHVRTRDLGTIRRRLRAAVERRAEHFAVSRLGVEPSLQRRREVVGAASHRAFYDYQPRPAAVATTLFFGDDIDDAVRHAEVIEGWEAVASSGIRVITVHGSHHDDAIMWPPAVDALAAAVRSELVT